MPRMHNMSVSAALLVSLLALSACTTQSKPEAAVAPAPVAAAAEPAAATKPAPVAEQAAPAPTVKAEAPAAKPVVKKHRKHRKAVKKAAKPAPAVATQAVPAAEPASVVQPEAQVAASQPSAVPVTAPVQPAEEKGFLESYWKWLLAIIIVVAALLWFVMGRKKE